jgi:hypothetical protein
MITGASIGVRARGDPLLLISRNTEPILFCWN